MAANESTERPLEGLTGRPIGYDDATWILTSAFIVFTMQSGFGLIESGIYATYSSAGFLCWWFSVPPSNFYNCKVGPISRKSL